MDTDKRISITSPKGGTIRNTMRKMLIIGINNTRRAIVLMSMKPNMKITKISQKIKSIIKSIITQRPTRSTIIFITNKHTLNTNAITSMKSMKTYPRM